MSLEEKESSLVQNHEFHAAAAVQDSVQNPSGIKYK